jgi:PhnB protein
MLLRFKDAPVPQNPDCAQPPGLENKVMHASFRIGDSVVMASDCHASGDLSFQGFSLSITVPTPADADRIFAALSEGGNVQMPLDKTFFSPRFGVVADKFGVSWMVYAAPEGGFGK